MNTTDSNPSDNPKENPDPSAYQKCWNRTKTWIAWHCDPEGPSLKGALSNALLIVIGLVFILLGLLLFIFDFTIEITALFNTSDSTIMDHSEYRKYIVGLLLLSGSTLFFVGRHSRRVALKTAMYNAEIDRLISTVNPKIGLFRPKEREKIQAAIEQLETFKDMPSEVSTKQLTFLRQIESQHLSRGALEVAIISDLSDYKYYNGEDDVYKQYQYNINETIKDCTFRGRQRLNRLIWELRDEIDYARFTYTHGEAILESAARWSIFAVVAFFYMGLAPLIEQPYFEKMLSFIHWSLIGAGGALLTTVIYVKTLDNFRVGEDEGDYVLRRVVFGTVLGAASALVLYMLLKSGLLGSPLLSKLNLESSAAQDNVGINALSVLLALIAGFSGRALDRMLNIGESTSM